jgi:hypothetical protein
MIGQYVAYVADATVKLLKGLHGYNGGESGPSVGPILTL